MNFRSGLEKKVSATLASNGIDAKFEPIKILYSTIPEDHKYTPDFVLGNDVLIEVKGYFTAQDRKKHLLLKYNYPDLNVHFVFGNKKNKLHKNSPTTYEDWCKKHGFECCDAKDVETLKQWSRKKRNSLDTVRLYKVAEKTNGREKKRKPSKPRRSTKT
jgi:hypothetical protein